MRWKEERKLLWAGIVILVVLNIFIAGFLVYNVFHSNAAIPQLLNDNDAVLIENTAKSSVDSVVYVVTEGNTGSGVIVSSDGLIVTNYHVIEDRKNISVRLYNKDIYHADVVGSDPSTDVALLRINASGLTPMLFGDSDNVEVGEQVLAVGNPFGYEFTVTSGIISAKNRDQGPSEYRDYLQTDASVNPGNSGGALVNLDGELVGITTFIVSRERTGELAFAIPSNLVKSVMDRLITDGTVRRGYLGVSISNYPVLDSDGNGRIVDGSRIEGLEKGGPAMSAGLMLNDTLISIDDVKITDSNQLRNYVAFILPGTTINVTVLRDGQKLTFPVVLAERPLDFSKDEK